MAKASEENGEPKSMTNLPVVANRHKPVALPTSHVETVVLLSQRKADDHIEVDLELDELDITSAESKATYAEIKDYVKEKYGVNVHTSYIAQVKRMCGLDMRENYNKSKKEKTNVKKCPQEKVEYIKDALKYFGLIK